MKINTTLIEGFDTMSPEEQLDALKNYDFTDLVDKSQFDKTASELANYKKQLRDKLSDEDKRKAEIEETLNSYKEQIEALQKEKRSSDLRNRFMGIGYPESEAKKATEALMNDDLDTLFTIAKTFNDGAEKRVRANILKEQKDPNGHEKKITKEDFKKMTTSERFQFSKENPEAYKEFYGGK